MITTENVWHFMAFGFLPLPGLLTHDEALAIREELERLGHERGQVPDDAAMEAGGIGDVAAIGGRVRALLLDERVYDIPAKILGHDFTYEGSDAQWHVGDTPWHGASGVTQKPLASIKVSFYLDDLDEGNGCLRIVPGGHHGGSARKRFRTCRCLPGSAMRACLPRTSRTLPTAPGACVANCPMRSWPTRSPITRNGG